MAPSIGALAAGLVLVQASRAQFNSWDWTQTQTPIPASKHSMVFDPVRNLTVAVGGSGGLSTIGWDGANWQFVGSGLQIYAMASAYDSARSRMVTFGGISNVTFQPNNQTREFGPTSASWTTVATTGPGARAYAHMAFDGTNCLLFGGQTVSGAPVLLNDSWTWNGTTWTLRAPAAAPPARAAASLALDTRRGVVVLFGGAGVGGALSDTWEWNGSNWSQITTPNAPLARSAHTMAFDASLQACVLTGGTDGTTSHTDTWTYDGVNWTQQSPVTLAPQRFYGAAAYDTVRERTVMYGGEFGNPEFDVWEYGNPNPASIAFFGAGCTASTGTLPCTMSAIPGFLGRPYIGSSLNVDVSNVPLGLLVVPVLSLSNTVWGGIPLPISMATLGLGPAACLVLVSPDVTGNLFVSTGTPTLFTLPIPPTFPAGARFFVQLAVFDVNGQLVTSNGADLVVQPL